MALFTTSGDGSARSAARGVIGWVGRVVLAPARLLWWCLGR